jgi:hypothetical protein
MWQAATAYSNVITEKPTTPLEVKSTPLEVRKRPSAAIHQPHKGLTGQICMDGVI